MGKSNQIKKEVLTIVKAALVAEAQTRRQGADGTQLNLTDIEPESTVYEEQLAKLKQLIRSAGLIPVIPAHGFSLDEDSEVTAGKCRIQPSFSGVQLIIMLEDLPKLQAAVDAAAKPGTVGTHDAKGHKKATPPRHP